MTDLEKFLDAIKGFGVGFDVENLSKGGTNIAFYQGDEKVIGYGGFMSAWSFDAEGKFESVGAWE